MFIYTYTYIYKYISIYIYLNKFDFLEENMILETKKWYVGYEI